MKRAFVIYLVVIIAGCYSKKAEVKKTGLEGQPMPAFDLIAADSVSHFNTQNIPVGKPAILFSFEPWCPYCRAQTKKIISQIEKLHDFTIYMLSTSNYNDLKHFNKKYELAKYPNIITGIDYKRSFYRYFHEASIPCLAIYGRDKKLKQVLNGKQYITTIQEVASQK